MNSSPVPSSSFPPPPLAFTLLGCPSRYASPAFVVWGLAGAFVEPCGCMGVIARTPLSAVERWEFMFGWLLLGQVPPWLLKYRIYRIYSIAVELKRSNHKHFFDGP
ncbi:MAG: hypothetical protein HF977_11325 [ANME-2 cluster archaeon]|nr:hypothetical protein [ANME-2 cluster archaeon]